MQQSGIDEPNRLMQAPSSRAWASCIRPLTIRKSGAQRCWRLARRTCSTRSPVTPGTRRLVRLRHSAGDWRRLRDNGEV